MVNQVNFADCYVLTNQRTYAFILSFLNTFIPHRRPYASEYEVPQQADVPTHVFTSDENLITYLENHPDEIHAIYWESQDMSNLKAAMCLFTSDGQVIVGLTCETTFPDTTNEQQCLKALQDFCQSTIGLIEYDTPAAKDTPEFLLRIRKQTLNDNQL